MNNKRDKIFLVFALIFTFLISGLFSIDTTYAKSKSSKSSYSKHSSSNSGFKSSSFSSKNSSKSSSNTVKSSSTTSKSSSSSDFKSGNFSSSSSLKSNSSTVKPNTTNKPTTSTPKSSAPTKNKKQNIPNRTKPRTTRKLNKSTSKSTPVVVPISDTPKSEKVNVENSSSGSDDIGLPHVLFFISSIAFVIWGIRKLIKKKK